MLKVYTSYSCSSCKKVLSWLKEEGIIYEEINFLGKGLIQEDINFMLKYAHNGFEDIISNRSRIFQKNEENLKEMTTIELINFIINNPSILKRPILVDDVTQKLIVGYNDINLEELV